MSKILILYYSRSGNTEKMARAITEGAKTVSNVEVDLSYYVSPEELRSFDAIIIGSPTYHNNMPIDIRKLFEAAGEKGIILKGKLGGAFGSYGWSGEAPKYILEIMKNRFEMKINEPPLITKYAPDQEVIDKCKRFGKRIAENLILKG